MCNRRADSRAIEGGAMHQEDVELDLAPRRAKIRRRMRRDYPDKRLIASRDLPSERREKLEETLSREDRMNLSRFRANLHPALRRWRVMAGRVEDPCAACAAKGKRTRSICGCGARPS